MPIVDCRVYGGPVLTRMTSTRSLENSIVYRELVLDL